MNNAGQNGNADDADRTDKNGFFYFKNPFLSALSVFIRVSTCAHIHFFFRKKINIPTIATNMAPSTTK